MTITTQNKTAGFSLPEMILSVAVLAILVTISFSTILQFLDQQRVKEEEKDLNEIKKALEAMVRDTGELPQDDLAFNAPNDWAEQIARYSNLSAAEIRTDSWSHPREYRVLSAPEVFRDAQFDVFYATVFSEGSDGQISDNSALGTTVTWWDNEALEDDAIVAYGAIKLAEDDMIVKFTDYKIKTENYFKTTERLKRISEAVETYAQVKLNEALVDNEAQRSANLDCGSEKTPAISVDPDTGLRDDTGVLCVRDNPTDQAAGPIPYPTVSAELFYPPSQAAEGVADTAVYNEKTTQDVDPFIGTSDDPVTFSAATDSVYNGDDSDLRKESMIDLMRLLGLPDSHCCNALSLVVDGTAAIAETKMEKPFYYFSNPRPRSTVGGAVTCGARPTTPPFLPPRITVDYKINDGGGTPISPPTCG